MDKYPISSNSLEKFYYVDGNHLGQQYKEYLSDYKQWDQRSHAEEWILFPENIGSHLSIDETALSNGDLYTVVTNKAAKGKKGCLVAMIEGTESENVIQVLKQIPDESRNNVKEVTLDMAGSMNKIVKICFRKASMVIDRFHVQKLAYDAVQEMRIAHRWDAINDENDAIFEAQEKGKTFQPFIFPNGDTRRQLLARSRYLLFKAANNWTEKQKERAKILFANYPDIKQAYDLTHSLRMIYSHTQAKGVAFTKLAQWYNKVAESEFKSFNTIAATMHTHYANILNFFDERSTNASAESFNSKLKAFRATQRGVNDMAFFMYRVSKIYG